ncbi:condensation domain-containing protein [Streptomyces sp. NPDC060198]|uniref:condensation domain-containing protein n=1 Tax=Streptomyces sp. NPDC060198 TaxID=3347070 RepID=UPI0036536764
MSTPHASPLLITPTAREGRLPVSFTQEERLETGRHVQLVNNKIPVGLIFEGPLDVTLLERCLEILGHRHESLRLCFPVDPAGHTLAVLPDLQEPLRVVSVEDTAPDRRLDHALALLAEDAVRPFELSTGPLFRRMVVRVDEHTHVLCMTMDHVNIDALSVRTLISELFALYESLAAGREPRLPHLPVQFPDFAAWERGYLRGPVLERLMGYWREQFDGIDPIPSSGLVDPAGGVEGPARLVKLSTFIDSERTKSIDAFAESLGTSLISVVGAAVKATVWRRRLDTVGDEAAGTVALFGSLGNRTRPETQHLVGYLATVATFRTTFDGSTTFSDLVGLVGRTLWDAMRHQRIPHSLIMKELGHPQYGARYGDPAGMPPYLNFDVLDYAMDTFTQPPGLSVRRVTLPTPEVPRGGLRVLGFRRPDGISLEFRYRSDRYGEAWAKDFLAELDRVLALGTGSPATRVHELFDVRAGRS